MPRGYDRALCIFPFDHRDSFQAGKFGWKSPLSDAQTAEIARARHVIYEGFTAALAAGVPKEKAGILVDEQFGAAILGDAAAYSIATACPVEKSGQEEFDFEYGEEFSRHIETVDPTFCKALVRYNPQDDRDLNKRQAARLQRLSEYLAARNRTRFIVELSGGQGAARKVWRQQDDLRQGAATPVDDRRHPRIAGGRRRAGLVEG